MTPSHIRYNIQQELEPFSACRTINATVKRKGEKESWKKWPPHKNEINSHMASPPNYFFIFNFLARSTKWLSSTYFIYWLNNALQKLFNQCVNFDEINPFLQHFREIFSLIANGRSLWLRCQIIPFDLVFLSKVTEIVSLLLRLRIMKHRNTFYVRIAFLCIVFSSQASLSHILSSLVVY